MKNSQGGEESTMPAGGRTTRTGSGIVLQLHEPATHECTPAHWRAE